VAKDRVSGVRQPRVGIVSDKTEVGRRAAKNNRGSILRVVATEPEVFLFVVYCVFR
jgi:hypothetical protein